MPIFDKLKSIFVVSEDAKNTASVEQNTTNNSNTTVSTTAPSEPIRVISPGQASDKFIEILHQVLEKNNQPGFDYLEYKKAVQSVAKLQKMDEKNKFKTAFAAAQAMNVQPSSLTESAKKYLSLLQVEETNFNQSANQFLANQVSNKENEAKSIQNSIQSKREQIENLKKELEVSEKRLVSLKSEIESAKEKVDSNIANFKASYTTVIDQIKSDIQKMDTYLK